MLGKALRYNVLGTGAVLAVVALTVLPATAGASVPPKTAAPVAFTGSVTCTVTGTLFSNPPLTMTSQKTTLTLSASLNGCTGRTTEKRVTITRGVLSASTTLTASCMALKTAQGVAPTGMIRWAAKNGSVVPTKLSFTGATSSVSTGNGAVTVSMPGTGTSTATGSFAGTSSKATVVFDQTWGSLAGQCLFPLGGGISEIAFTGHLGPSAASIG